MANRRHAIIDQLEPQIQETVKEMLRANFRPDGSMQCVSGLICSYAGRVEHNPRQRRATIRISIAGKLHRITLAVRYV